jgi:hypothetical protein
VESSLLRADANGYKDEVDVFLVWGGGTMHTYTSALAICILTTRASSFSIPKSILVTSVSEGTKAVAKS